MNKIFFWYYCLHLFDAFSLIVAFYIFYFTFGAFLKNKKASAFRITNLILLIITIYVIINTTIISRAASEYKTVITPFYSFVVAKTQPEMWRQMYMNVALFIPFGIFLVNIFSDKIKPFIRVALTSATGALLSLTIELSQHFYSLGEAWTDDVICNALGAFCGATIIYAIDMFTQKHIKRTDE